MQTFLLLAPDFALILLGCGLYRHAGFPEDFWVGLEKLVYFVLFPALLFGTLVRTHIDVVGMFPLFVAGWLTMLAGLLLGLAGKPFMGLRPITFASRLQCAFRFNTYIAIAVAGKVYGLVGIATMGAMVGAMVPLANIAAVSLLARHGSSKLLGELVRNPLILATLAGIAFNLADLVLPKPFEQFFARLSDASISLGLLAVGAALRWGSIEGHWLGSAWLVVVKLLLLPLVAWFLAPALGLTGITRDIAVLFAALPTASSAYILAVRMGGDGAGVAWLISATTLLSVFTMTFWLGLL